MTKIGYILKQDILTFLGTDPLTQITGGRKEIGTQPAQEGDDVIWEKIVPAAIEIVKGYSRHWYDIDTEMREYYEYSVADAFTTGQRVASTEDVDENRTLYVCIQDAPPGTLLTDPLYFEEKDDRNAVLVEITATIIIYTTNKRLNPRQVPEQRILDYDNAIARLKDIQKGAIDLFIAQRTEVEPDDAGHQVAYGDWDNVDNAIY